VPEPPREDVPRPPAHDVLDGLADGPPEPPVHYAPEQVLALHVLWQAVIDLRDRDARIAYQAACFLVAEHPYETMHAFWCALINRDSRAAVSDVLIAHGTRIAQLRSHMARQRLAATARVYGVRLGRRPGL
jgi:hypothetical protein